MCWNNDIQVTLVESNDNLIIVRINGLHIDKTWLLFGVYGSPRKHKKHALWDYIRRYYDNINVPQATIGDFNEIKSVYEKSGVQI